MSCDGVFVVYIFDVWNGEVIWCGCYDWEINYYGKYFFWLVIVEGKIYLCLLMFDLEMGNVLVEVFLVGY